MPNPNNQQTNNAEKPQVKATNTNKRSMQTAILVRGTSGNNSAVAVVVQNLFDKKSKQLEKHSYPDTAALDLTDYRDLTEQLTMLALSSRGDYLRVLDAMDIVKAQIRQCVWAKDEKRRSSDKSTLPVTRELRDDVAKFFAAHDLEQENDTACFKRTVGVGSQEYSIDIRKIGRTEQLRREVEAWLKGDTLKLNPPPKYKDRKTGEDKKLSALEFFNKHYSSLIGCRAIYAHEVLALDKPLYMGISVAVDGGISQLLPKKSEMITDLFGNLTMDGHVYAAKAMQTMHKTKFLK